MNERFFRGCGHIGRASAWGSPSASGGRSDGLHGAMVSSPGRVAVFLRKVRKILQLLEKLLSLHAETMNKNEVQ